MAIHMKKIIFFLLVSILASGCMTVKRIQRNCDAFAKICAVDVQHEIRYRDTIIYLDPIAVRLPESDVNITSILQVKSGMLNLKKITKKQGLITIEVSIVNNELQVNAYLNDSTILAHPDPVRIDDAIKTEQLTRTIPVKYIPKAYKFAFWIVLIEVIILILYFFLKKSGKSFKDILNIVLSRIK